MTNARFASLHRLPVALLPFADARSTTQILALVTSEHLQLPQEAAGFRLALAAALRLRGFTQLVPPAPPSLARRQHPTEADEMIVIAHQAHN